MVKKRNRQKNVTAADATRWKSLLVSGMAIRDIAQKFDRSRDVIRGSAKDGWDLPGKPGPARMLTPRQEKAAAFSWRGGADSSVKSAA